MSQPVPAGSLGTSHFDAAKAIVETLKDIPRDQQLLAVRFACETLGLQTPGTGSSGAMLAPQLTKDDAPPKPLVPDRPMDIKQFTASKAPKTDQQFAVVVAYFYQFLAPTDERKEAISAKDLAEGARLVERKRPHRITLNNAKAAGYLNSAGHGKFKINTVGENLVAVGLPSNGAGSDSGTGSKRAKKTSTKRKTTKKKRKSKNA